MAITTRQWEEFHGGPTEPPSERLHVTINARCVLVINRRTARALGNPASVMLLFDRRNQAIGVRAAGPSDIKPFPLLPHPNGSHSVVNARPFCRHYAVNPPQCLRFTTPNLDRDKTLVLHLHQTEPIRNKRRKPRDDDSH